jgi:hypothetical protein
MGRASCWQVIASSYPAQPLVDDAEVAQAVGLALAVAQLPEDVEAVLQAGDRLLVPPKAVVDEAEIIEGMGLGGPVPGAAGKLQGGLVGPGAVLPVATDVEELEQGSGELAGQLRGNRGDGCGGLGDGGQQVGPLRF